MEGRRGQLPPNPTGLSQTFESAGIKLPSADRLSPVGRHQAVCGVVISCVVAIIGPTDAGKTSLIASLYDLLQEGPVAGIGFARSLTLHAFEQACHDARAALATRRSAQRTDAAGSRRLLSPRR